MAEADARAKASAEKLVYVEEQLAERFQALSTRALDVNNLRFLELAETRLARQPRRGRRRPRPAQAGRRAPGRAAQGRARAGRGAAARHRVRPARRPRRAGQADGVRPAQPRAAAGADHDAGPRAAAARGARPVGRDAAAQGRRDRRDAAPLRLRRAGHRGRAPCGPTWWCGWPAARTSWSTPRSRWPPTWRPRRPPTSRAPRYGSTRTPGTCASTSTGWPPSPTGRHSTRRRSSWCCSSPARRSWRPRWSATRPAGVRDDAPGAHRHPDHADHDAAHRAVRLAAGGAVRERPRRVRAGQGAVRTTVVAGQERRVARQVAHPCRRGVQQDGRLAGEPRPGQRAQAARPGRVDGELDAPGDGRGACPGPVLARTAETTSLDLARER